MTFQLIPGGLLYPPVEFAIGPYGFAPLVLDASGERVAFVFRAPKTGNIAHIGFPLGTVTTGQTLKVSLQNVTAASGNPDDVVDQSGTVAVADGDDNTWKQVTLGAVRAVTVGDCIACVIEFDSTIGNLEIRTFSASFTGNFVDSCYILHRTGGAWAKQNSVSPALDIIYGDVTRKHIWGNYPVKAITGVGAHTGTTPDEFGMKIRVPFKCRVDGVWFVHDSGFSASPFDAILYDGTTAVEVASRGAGEGLNQAATGLALYFANQVELTPGTYYRAILKPTTGAGSVGTKVFEVDTAPVWDNWAIGGSDCMYTTRVDAGAWVDDALKRMPGGFIISHIDDAVAGAGAGVGPRMMQVPRRLSHRRRRTP